MKADTKRIATWVVAGLAAVAVLAWVLRPAPIVSDLASVSRGALRITLDEEGETRVRDRFVISAPVAGRVARIELDPGDPVVAGETVLAIFEPADPVPLDARSRAEAQAAGKAAEAAGRRTRAERERSEAELGFAIKEADRFRRLADEEVVSQEALEAAELAVATRTKSLRAARFAEESARYELEVAKARLMVSTGNRAGEGATLEIRSPVDGQVLRLLRESEAVVPAGQPLLEVSDPRDLEIVADFLSSEAVKIRRAQQVAIEEWGGEGTLEGVVRRVEPSGFTKISALGVEEQRVNVIIDLVSGSETRGALGDGFRVEVRVVVWEGEDLVKVPTSCLFRHGEGWAVFAAEGGRARLTPVEIGRDNGLEAELLGGLGEGATVIVHPSDSIEDGARIKERAAVS